MSFTNPSVTDFKNYFVRDFPYGTNIDKHVLNADISRALSDADFQINISLFNTQSEYTKGYLLLAAHYLCLNIQSSSQGLSGKFEWATSSKSVGSVSIGQQIPSSISENPMFSFFTSTNYGAQYIMMVLPRLVGPVFIAEGGTNA